MKLSVLARCAFSLLVLGALCALPAAAQFDPGGDLPQEAKKGMGDPITVGEQKRPVSTSIDKWVAELIEDPDKLQLAEDIVGKLDADDVKLWGYDKAELFAPLEAAQAEGRELQYRKPKVNNYVLQRKIMLALKKDIDRRPHGKLLRRVRYYCNVLLRE